MGVWNGRHDLLFCANYPGHEGELTHVSGCGVVVDCRRFCRKWETAPAEVSGIEGVRFISIGHGRAVMVDAADFEWLNKHKWCSRGGPGGYAATMIDRKMVFMHRLIMDAPAGLVVDHTNGNKHDNRRSNLRKCTQSENRRNSRKSRGTSRFKGVSWLRTRGKWQANIYHDGKSIHLGLFDDEIEAAMAYDRKARELFGEFACLNFPELGRIVTVAKSEFRPPKGARLGNPKSKTSSNAQKPKFQTEPLVVRLFRAFSHLDFGDCFGFRVSDFEFPQLWPWATGPPADGLLLFENFIRELSRFQIATWTGVTFRALAMSRGWMRTRRPRWPPLM
jgi:hypothetical protein